MDVENEPSPPPPPPPIYESFASQKDAQEVCVWCRVLELLSPFYGMYKDNTVKNYATHKDFKHVDLILLNAAIFRR